MSASFLKPCASCASRVAEHFADKGRTRLLTPTGADLIGHPAPAIARDLEASTDRRKAATVLLEHLGGPTSDPLERRVGGRPRAEGTEQASEAGPPALTPPGARTVAELADKFASLRRERLERLLRLRDGVRAAFVNDLGIEAAS